jgi:hypothetical protein
MGNSLGRMIVPQRTSRDEGGFSEWIERLLHADGIDGRVENRSRWYELIGTGSERWRSELRQLTPDVVVVVYGSVECQPNVVPTGASRHFMTWDQRLGGPGGWYRNHVSPPAWRQARSFQRWASKRDVATTWRLPPKRYRTELLELVRMIRQEKALTLLLDIPPFGPRIEHHMPGLAARRDRFQALVRETVESVGDPDVRIVPVSSVVDELGFDAALPDGLHLTAAGHRRMADLLLAEIRPWMQARGVRATA